MVVARRCAGRDHDDAAGPKDLEHRFSKALRKPETAGLAGRYFHSPGLPVELQLQPLPTIVVPAMEQVGKAHAEDKFDLKADVGHWFWVEDLDRQLTAATGPTGMA